MILIDTSAWVEFLRATGSPEHLEVKRLLGTQEVGVVDLVAMELLAGAVSEEAAQQLARFLARFTAVASSSPADHQLAASLYRRGRVGGRTVRSLIDCLIAAVALRLDAPLLARDRDYDVLAEICPLTRHLAP